jgi:hypothetical protein
MKVFQSSNKPTFYRFSRFQTEKLVDSEARFMKFLFVTVFTDKLM